MNVAGLLQFFMAVVIFSWTSAQDCSVNINSLNEKAPLIVKKVGAGPEYELIGADANGKVILRDGNYFDVTCANSGVPIQNMFFKVVCRRGIFKRLSVPGGREDSIDLQSFGCGLFHSSFVQQVPKNNDRLCPSGSRYTQFRIGFRIPGVFNSFIPWIDVCTDTDTKSTIFTKHILHGKRCPSGRCSSYFRTTDEYERVRFLLGGLDAKKCYVKTNQVARFPGAVTGVGEFYFARGHLTPDADAINKAFGKATYYYLNVIPQWQVINNGNWKSVEDSTRELATKYGVVTVYTGTHEYQTLSGHDTFCETAGKGIRIPKFMYKVVIVEEIKTSGVTRRGIAFITSNNPTASVRFPCSDVCGSSKFFVGKDATRKSFAKGETICCSVADLKRVVGHLASIPNTVGLLINV